MFVEARNRLQIKRDRTSSGESTSVIAVMQLILFKLKFE